jgi:hypothetical protein
LRKAVADSVPPALRKLNLEAFDKGLEYGTRTIERLAEEGESEPVISTMEVN